MALDGMVTGVVETASGTAYTVEVYSGDLLVGDVVGIYGPGAKFPSFDATVNAMRVPGQHPDAAKGVKNNSGGRAVMLCGVYLDAPAASVEAGMLLGPSIETRAREHGFSDADIQDVVSA